VAKPQQDVDDRQARLAQMRASQRRTERRRNFLIIGTAVAVAVILVAVTAVVLVREQRREAALEAAAARPIEGVQDFGDLAQEHTNEPVDYPQSPPVGGIHAPVWTNCGVYTDPVVPEQTVHSLEHGAVWVTYQPDLATDQVEALTAVAERNPYVVLSPYEGLTSPVVLSAWGKQLALDSVEDPRLELFLRAYQQGEQTPELGAPCTGGVGGV
jgi:hypothetical protein